ncbi:MAG: hypothetical protein EOP07_03670 [Proteobacteria bacterium]|nr:MAG: hypothetical protein EOP07_03670 [Pseudomonadota bacterium]
MLSKKLWLALTLVAFTSPLVNSCKSVSGDRSNLASEVSPRTELFSRTLENEGTYQAYSQLSNGLISNGRSVKFLIDKRSAKPSLYFINSNYAGKCKHRDEQCSKYHYYFAREQLGITMDGEEFNNSTYFTQDKAFVAGTLSSYDLGDKGKIYAIQLFPQDVAKDSIILEIAQMMRASMKIPGVKLVFLATGNQQSTGNILGELNKLDISVMSVDQVLGSSPFIPMHPGEAWGYLRIFPKDQDNLAPTDIVVFDELPLDLSVVAAVMTKSFQDTNSHINLKSKERNTPNMILRDAGPTNPTLAPFLDKPVHLVVSKMGWKIEASTPEIVQAKAAERYNRAWQKILWTSTRTVLSYDSMCVGKTSACLSLSKMYGSKASNLGFLKELFKDRKVDMGIIEKGQPRVTKTLAYDPTPIGLGVPLQFYSDIVELPSNATLKQKINNFVEKEMSGQLSSADRSTLALDIRETFMNAEIPAANLAAVQDVITKIGPTIPEWKVRSSANAEDIENFDGAGLHDSYSSKQSSKDNPEHSCKLVVSNASEPGELTKMKVSPKTLSCAMKGVYASLWNKRAIEERSFAHIDHSSVAMGLALVPNYDTESPIIGNSVVVTRVINSEDVMGQTLSIQKDNNTVTNPTPGTWSETTIAASASPDEIYSLSTVRYAKPTATTPVLTGNVLSKELTLEMVALSRKIELAYCRANGNYYKNGSCNDVPYDSEKGKALDMEMKVLQNGEFIIKQVREFSGK